MTTTELIYELTAFEKDHGPCEVVTEHTNENEFLLGNPAGVFRHPLPDGSFLAIIADKPHPEVIIGKFTTGYAIQKAKEKTSTTNPENVLFNLPKKESDAGPEPATGS